MADTSSQKNPNRPVISKTLTKRRRVIVILISVIFGLALGAAGYVGYKQFFMTEDESATTPLGTKKSPQALTTANPLDGTQVEPSLANRHPLAIVIENPPQARPQIGLDKASIIYEAITEGGITRFLAIFGPRDTSKIGPVRSMRTFFIDWSWEYKAFLGHVGGNIDALDRIPVEGALDLDQFALGEKAYWREIESGKAIEHTMYSNTDKLY